MTRNLKAFLIIVVLAVTGMNYLLKQRTSATSHRNSAKTSPKAPALEIAATKIIGDSTAPPSPEVKTVPSHMLTLENFEELAQSCFRGEPCDFTEDPWKMYLHFRDSQHPRICDSIIAVMRRKMSEPEFKEKYKGPLLSMIEDFYPPREIEFQVAAYYAYVGELEKSLSLYLALEKRAAADPVLRGAPKLNIANVYFDLKRFQEALPYYQAALAELKSAPDKLNDQRSVVEFIEKRIAEIESKGTHT